MAKKILIIDDELSTLKLLKNRLASEGYDIVTARDGKSGIAQAEKEKPDLILLDVVLVGSSGYNICKSIKSNEATKAIKVIIFTNKLEAVDGVEARKSGADEFIAKLADSTLLLETIRTLI